MNNKEMKEYYNNMTLGEIRGKYEEELRLYNLSKDIIKETSLKLSQLENEDKHYLYKLNDFVDTIKYHQSDLKMIEKELNIIKPILDKKEAEGINQQEYEKYMNDNKDNIQLLILKIKEMEKQAIKEHEENTNWKVENGWDEEQIIFAHESTLKELIWMLKDNVGNIKEVNELEFNNNRGFDGVIKGENGNVKINTIIAGGYNIQKLHYRTLIYKF